MPDRIDFAQPRDFMRLAGAPVLVATLLLGTAKALAETGRTAYGTAFELGLGIVTGSLACASLLLVASLCGHALLPGPRSRTWVGRAAWATSRLALALAMPLVLAAGVPATGILWS